MLPEGMSLDQLREKINRMLNAGLGDEWRFYVRDLYEDRVVYHEHRTGDYFEAPYTVTPDGEVTLGEARKVKTVYVAARSVSVEGAPSEVQVIPFGRHETAKGDFVLNAEDMAAVIEDFASRQNDMVIDYEHQTLAGGEAPAAGWIKKLIDKGKEGLWAAVEWTPRAVEYLKNKEYRYLSPVFLKRKADDRVVRLLNAGLTNTPAIDGMVPLVNKEDGGDTHISRSTEDELKKKKEVQIMKKLLVLLGLSAEATEDQAVEAMKQVQARAALGGKALELLELKDDVTDKDVETVVVALKAAGDGVHKDVLEALELKEGATVSEAIGTITAMKAGHGQAEDLGKEVAALKARVVNDDAEAAVAQAMKEGKVTPAHKDWALGYAKRDLEGFKAFAAKATVVVNPKEIVINDLPGGSAVADGLQADINKMCGVSDEAFEQFGPKGVA